MDHHAMQSAIADSRAESINERTRDAVHEGVRQKKAEENTRVLHV